MKRNAPFCLLTKAFTSASGSGPPAHEWPSKNAGPPEVCPNVKSKARGRTSLLDAAGPACCASDDGADAGLVDAGPAGGGEVRFAAIDVHAGRAEEEVDAWGAASAG